MCETRSTEQPRHDIEHPIDGDRKANALGSGPHGHVDADHLPVDVEERAAGVARVDARIGLDQVIVPLGAAHFDIAVQGRNDSPSQGVLVAVGIPQGKHGLADHQIA